MYANLKFGNLYCASYSGSMWLYFQFLYDGHVALVYEHFYVITFYNPSSFIISKMSMYVGPTHTEALDNTIEFINAFGLDHVCFDLYLLVKLGK